MREITKLEKSLLLLKIEKTKVVLFDDGNIKLRFHYKNEKYKSFHITDLKIKKIKTKDDLYIVNNEIKESDNILVVVSLANKHTDDKCYKVIAKIFTNKSDK